MLKCKLCGAIYPEDVKTCKLCGYTDVDPTNTKLCKKCGHYRPHGKNQRMCKECMTVYRDSHHTELWIQQYLRLHPDSDKDRLQYLVNTVRACPICGVKLYFKDRNPVNLKGLQFNSPTIEKRDGKLQIVCNICSKIKNRIA